MDNIYDVDLLKRPTTSSSVNKVRQWNFTGVEYHRLDIKQSAIQPTIELFHIPFRMKISGEYILIESPEWPSLQSFGKTKSEAISSMIDTIINVGREYIFTPEHELTEDAIEFRKFLIRKLLK